MKTILKYLRPFAVLIVLDLLCLLLQAYCALQLPNLMSDIVNNGIQYSGITERAPKQLSADGMQLVAAFLPEQDAQALQNSYRSSDGVYSALWTADEASAAAAGDLYGRACYSLVRFLSDTAGGTGASDSSFSAAETEAGKLYDLALPLVQKAGEAARGYGDPDPATDYSAYGKAFTRLFYSELGIDVPALQRNYILREGGVMIGVTLLSMAAAVGVSYCAARVGAGMSRNLRHDVFAKVESFSNAEYNRFSTASLITRTTNDVQQLQQVAMMGMRVLCYAPIMGVGGVVMAIAKSPSQSWIIAVAVLVLVGFVAVMFGVAVPKFNLLQKLIDRLNLVSRESLSGMMVIRAFGNEAYEEQRFERANDDLARTNRFVQRAVSLMMPVMSVLMNVMTLAVVWFGAKAIAASTLQIGDMMAFIQYATQIMLSFLMISMMFLILPRAAVSARRVNEVLCTENEILDPAAPKTLPAAAGGREIAFRHVSFRYHNAEADVLSDVDFVAKAGETTAFIGSTGSGKSTLVNLIPRFYDVTAGSVELDGVDIRELTQRELRGEIGYIPQKGTLFSGTVASNLQYGRADATEGEMQAAVDAAQAAEFVAAMEGGLGADIAQGGDNVSGGQKQRLAIARALIKKAPVYIFDDSFSALDFRTDAALRHALRGYTNGATVLIVAQRVSTILDADKIVVLDNGRIVGVGTHRELLASCTTYREIAQSQLTAEELA